MRVLELALAFGALSRALQFLDDRSRQPARLDDEHALSCASRIVGPLHQTPFNIVGSRRADAENLP